MIKNTASLDLVEFVEQNILPQYANFDKAHGLSHVMAVIRRSIDLVRSTGADINMVYVVAAYHDLGCRDRVPSIISRAARFLLPTCVCAAGSPMSR